MARTMSSSPKPTGKREAKRLVGRTIVDVDLRPFQDNYNDWHTDPKITLDDGTVVLLGTREVELCDASACLVISRKPKKKTGPR